MNAQLGRFIVRGLVPWEAPELFKLTGDPEVTRYMGFRTHQSEDEAMNAIMAYSSSQAKWQAVCSPDAPGEILGVIGLEIQRHQAAMTIMFKRSWKTRGAGREVSVPFVEWVFTHPQIWRVWAFCHVDNMPVQRVLERMGALREGRLRRFEVFPNISAEPQDVYAYSIVRG